MRIELLPALNGDSILVEYTTDHFILIDGGYVDTYQKYLLPRLKEIAAGGGIIDLIVVSHIDGDHISGIIKFLEEDDGQLQCIQYGTTVIGIYSLLPKFQIMKKHLCTKISAKRMTNQKINL